MDFNAGVIGAEGSTRSLCALKMAWIVPTKGTNNSDCGRDRDFIGCFVVGYRRAEDELVSLGIGDGPTAIGHSKSTKTPFKIILRQSVDRFFLCLSQRSEGIHNQGGYQIVSAAKNNCKLLGP